MTVKCLVITITITVISTLTIFCGGAMAYRYATTFDSNNLPIEEMK